jgi:hypothetical protein
MPSPLLRDRRGIAQPENRRIEEDHCLKNVQQQQIENN